MTKNHGVGFYSDKDRRKIRRTYKAIKDKRVKNPVRKEKNEHIVEDYWDEDSEY